MMKSILKRQKKILDDMIKKKYLVRALVKNQDLIESLSNRFPALHKGEVSVLTMAYSRKKECRVIIDESHGRDVAKRLGLRYNGVFGLLLELYKEKEIDLNNLKNICEKIDKSSFWIDFKKLGYEWLLK